MKPCTFEWMTDNPRYNTSGNVTKFKEGGTEFYRPVLGATVFEPFTGKHYWEVAINVDNMRLGVATLDADTNAEMGLGKGLYSINMQNGSCQIEGEEKKKLWRLIMATAGGRLGFCWDSDNGTLQLWYNDEFQGTGIHADFGLKGKPVRAAVGIAGVEANNRDIGVGMKAAVVLPVPQRVPKTVM